MDILAILLVGALTFGLCFALDKGFIGIFRNKKQHKTGRSVRLGQHYGGAGVVLGILAVIGIFQGAKDNTVLLFGSCVVGALGIGLIVYYMSFGIYYDDESFILTTFGRKSVTYSYGDICGQKLYLIAGGSVVVELHLRDGRTIGLQTTMSGVYPFLDAAFDGWCAQTNVDPAACEFHDPSVSHWFPEVE